MHKIDLYHGSTEIIQNPSFFKGKATNDYGKGFYCTRHIELAREWACLNEGDGYANHYEIDLDGMKCLNLLDEKFTILHWLTLLLRNRNIRISTPLMQQSMEWLVTNFTIDSSKYDLMIGYRADDSYFSFARAFISNQISLAQLANAMQLGKLGEQYVLKSEKAFSALNFVAYEVSDHLKYYIKRKKRDEDAREAFLFELTKTEADGIYMRDLMQEGVKADDPRLR